MGILEIYFGDFGYFLGNLYLGIDSWEIEIEILNLYPNLKFGRNRIQNRIQNRIPIRNPDRANPTNRNVGKKDGQPNVATTVI